MAARPRVGVVVPPLPLPLPRVAVAVPPAHGGLSCGLRTVSRHPSCGLLTFSRHLSCGLLTISRHLSCGLLYTISRHPRYEAEEKKLLDGSFARRLDASLLRQEQYEMLAELPRTAPHHPGIGRWPPPPPLGALLPTLLRALRILRWSHVAAFYSAGKGAGGNGGGHGGAAPPDAARYKLALGQLEVCADWLLAACDVDGRRQRVDWEALRSGEGRAKGEWLVVCVLSVYSLRRA